MAHYEKLSVSNLMDAVSINLKQTDKDELLASQGCDDWMTIIQASIDSSDEVYVIYDDDHVAIGVFGLAVDPTCECRAYPWLLAAEELKDHARAFLRESIDIVEGWADRYDILCNLVSADNHVSIRWLEWLGFKVDRYVKFYLEDERTVFYQFSRVLFDV